MTRIFEHIETNGFAALLIPTTILAFLILVLRAGDRTVEHDMDEATSPQHPLVKLGYGLPLLLWFLAATVSLIANEMTPEAQMAYSVAFIGGAIVYFACRGVSVDDAFLVKIFVALSLGALFPLVLGAQAYYNEWGVPTAEVLIFARYDVLRMASYNEATFDSLSNTAPFLIMLAPPLIVLVMQRGISVWVRGLFTVVLILLGVHLLITQMRAAFIAMGVISAVIVMYYRKSLTGLSLALFISFATALLLFPMLGATDIFFGRLVSAAMLNRAEDSSISDRMDSIDIGWNVFMDNFAAGSGLATSRFLNIHSSAHQFNVKQASELGILAFVGTIMLMVFVFRDLAKLTLRGNTDSQSTRAFVLLLAPSTYLFYCVISNATLALSLVNTWVVLLAAFLALSETALRQSNAQAAADARAAQRYSPPTLAQEGLR